jgi:hypothetical protein
VTGGAVVVVTIVVGGDVVVFTTVVGGAVVTTVVAGAVVTMVDGGAVTVNSVVLTEVQPANNPMTIRLASKANAAFLMVPFNSSFSCFFYFFVFTGLDDLCI